MARILSPPKPRNSGSGGTAPSAPIAPPTAPVVAPPAPISQPAGEPPADAGAVFAAERSLLRRAAGRGATVLTGWAGLRAPSTPDLPRRKSLLGE